MDYKAWLSERYGMGRKRFDDHLDAVGYILTTPKNFSIAKQLAGWKDTMFDPKKPVQTRNGKKARIVCTDAHIENRPIVAMVAYTSLINDRPSEVAGYFRTDGRICRDKEDADDLVNIPTEVTVESHVIVHLEEGIITGTYRSYGDAIEGYNGYPNKEKYGVIKLTGKYTR